MDEKKDLTMTDSIRTLVNEEQKPVDASVKKLLAELRSAEDDRWRAQVRISNIRAALKIIGVTPQGVVSTGLHGDPKEEEYARRQPFKELTLAETCERILNDYRPNWLTRSQVEYLATRGGYNFSTKNVGNSVDITLRRMADTARIEAERVRGSRGSRYRGITRFPRESPHAQEQLDQLKGT
jgi:hypothetical protein